MARRKLTQEQLDEFNKCREDVVYFITTYGWLKHNVKGPMRWDRPYPYQVELWELLQAGKSIVVNKTRQIGVSWSCAAYAIWLIIFHPAIEILFLSETEKKAIRLLKCAKFFFNQLPTFLKPTVYSNSVTRFSVRFSGRSSNEIYVMESSIDSLTLTERAGASYSAAFVLMDEAAHLEHGEAAFMSIKPSIAHGGQMAIVSTPGGVNNMFFRIWNEVVKGDDPLFVPIIAYWRDCGLSPEWYEIATSNMTATQILQEFELQFLSTGSWFFDPVQLAACYRPIEEEPVLTDIDGHVISERTNMSFTGVDTAEGTRTKSGVPDYTSIITLNEYGVEIATWHSNKAGVEEVAGYTMILDDGRRVDVDGVVTGWHANYPGGMVIERFGPGDVVHARHCTRVPDDPRSYAVVRRTLAVAGRQVVIRDAFTYACMQSFEDRGGGKYEATEGFFDDPVIALALAYAELNKHGGYQLDIPERTAGGRRMIAIDRSDDVDPSRIRDVLPVGEIMQGPVFEFDAGYNVGRELDAIDKW
jgi:hypothetical protein